MAQKIGVAVVGVDHWYTAFPTAEAAAKMKGTRLVAVADKSRTRAQQVAGSHNPDYVTSDLRRVIADPNVDVVCSLLNTRDSVRLTKAALEAGKHMVCVKPMAMNLRQLDALIALAEKRKRVLWCFDQLGRQGVDPQVKAAMTKGVIGKPLVFHHLAWAGLPKPWRDRVGPSWWIDAKLVPWGAWADHAIYTIDMLRALLKSEVVEVHGQIANRVHRKLTVEDWGVGTLRFANGMVAVLEDAWTADGYWPHWTKIVGTRGVIHTERAAFGDKVMVATASGVKPAPKGSTRKRRSFLETPLKLIRTNAAVPSPARDSRVNHAICLAVYKAAKTGRYVDPRDM